MIDFLKLVLPERYADILQSHPNLEFHYVRVPVTGENRTVNYKGRIVTPRQNARHRGMLFTIFDGGRVEIEGSIHKYWNDGEHNFNDFGINDLANEITQFNTTYGIEPEDANITQLEFGVNIQVNNYPIDSILHNIFFHRKVPFLWTFTKTEGKYFQARHDLYRIKIYDKTRQYERLFNVPDNLLRVEINFQGVQLRKLYNLRTLNDLIHIPFQSFIETLKQEIGLILFYDFTIKHNSIRLFNYAKSFYWCEFIQNKQSSSYSKHREKLKGYIKYHSENVMDYLVDLIDVKCNELSKGGVSIQSIHEYINSTPQSNPKRCLVTGYDISMQKEESKFLNVTGLRYYKNLDIESYQGLELQFLTGHWYGETEIIQMRQISHNVRNRYRNNFSKYYPNQLSIY